MKPLIALTGVSGFLGGHVAAAFAEAGWRLRVLTRRDPRLDVGPEPVEIVLGDLGRLDALATLTRGADAVVHLAGTIRGRTLQDFLAANRDGTAALARAWRDAASPGPFVLVSSLAAREPHLSPYAASKRAGEDAAAETVGAQLRVLRPTAIYGPGDRETLALFKAARGPAQPLLGPPDGRVTLVHARDVAQAAVAAAGVAPAGRWEVSDDASEGYSWARIVEEACRAVGARPRRVQLPPAAVRAAGFAAEAASAISGSAGVMSAHKAREILHSDWSSSTEAQLPPDIWTPKIGLRDGFAATAAWYRQAGWLPQRRPRS